MNNTGNLSQCQTCGVWYSPHSGHACVAPFYRMQHLTADEVRRIVREELERFKEPK